jgi:CubicO group peptidase (beta-lactamase class C family)
MASNVSRRLGAVVAKAMERFKIPGAAAGVILDGEEHHVYKGITCIDWPSDVDENTLFQIGSTTKTFTGTALMMLVEEGKVDLDSRVRDYIPKFKLADENAAAGLKVRHLVTHTGGFLGDYFDDLGRGADALKGIVARLRTKTPQLTPLGTVWSYNNAGFYVLGRVLEIASGMPYEDLVNSRILGPLGMTNSFWFAEDVITRKAAIGHALKADGSQTIARPWGVPRTANPAGGIVSTVSDQLRYARFHMGDGRVGTGRGAARLLKASSVKKMQKPLAHIGWALADDVGVTWLLDKYGNTPVVKHGGSINGHMSEFVMVPSKGFALTVLTNGQRGHELGSVVIEWCLDQLLGLRRPAPVVTSLKPAALAAYTGRYPVGMQGDYVITAENGGLLLTLEINKDLLEADPDIAAQLPPPLPLGFVAKDRAVVQGDYIAGSRVEFLRAADGDVEWVRFGGRITKRTPAT